MTGNFINFREIVNGTFKKAINLAQSGQHLFSGENSMVNDFIYVYYLIAGEPAYWLSCHVPFQVEDLLFNARCCDECKCKLLSVTITFFEGKESPLDTFVRGYKKLIKDFSPDILSETRGLIESFRKNYHENESRYPARLSDAMLSYFSSAQGKDVAGEKQGDCSQDGAGGQLNLFE